MLLPDKLMILNRFQVPGNNVLLLEIHFFHQTKGELGIHFFLQPEKEIVKLGKFSFLVKALGSCLLVTTLQSTDETR